MGTRLIVRYTDSMDGLPRYSRIRTEVCTTPGELNSPIEEKCDF